MKPNFWGFKRKSCCPNAHISKVYSLGYGLSQNLWKNYSFHHSFRFSKSYLILFWLVQFGEVEFLSKIEIEKSFLLQLHFATTSKLKNEQETSREHWGSHFVTFILTRLLPISLLFPLRKNKTDYSREGQKANKGQDLHFKESFQALRKRKICDFDIGYNWL